VKGSGSFQGLCVSPRISVRRRRQLPVKGEVLVGTGDAVEMDTVIARADLPGAFRPIPAAAKLGIPPSELGPAMCVREGEGVKKGEVLARSRSWFGLVQSTVKAPMDGVVESVSPATGQLVLREKPIPLELAAYVPGRVAESDGCSWVDIEAEVCLVQGILGVGGECRGRLVQVGRGQGEILDAGDVPQIDGNVILFTGGPVTAAVLTAMRERGVRGVVAASARGSELMAWTGGALNPASTGRESLGLTVVLTEGFGHLAMTARTFGVLAALDGRPVSMSGITQIRAGVIRPEVLAAPLPDAPLAAPAERGTICPGDRVRIIRGGAFGKTGRVHSIPDDLVRIATGARTLVYEIELDDGTRERVPRQNTEWISDL
jgi:hypothetical protein